MNKANEYTYSEYVNRFYSFDDSLQSPEAFGVVLATNCFKDLNQILNICIKGTNGTYKEQKTDRTF